MNWNPFRPPPGTAPILAPPPILFLFFLGAAWGSDALFPWRLEGFSEHLRLWLAGAGLLSAAVWGGWGVLTLRRAGTPVEPREATVRLVAVGPYRFSRNPLYLALTTVQASFGLLTGSVWFLLAVPCLFVTLHFGVVLREEGYLRGLFPEEYGAYCRKVRRWI